MLLPDSLPLYSCLNFITIQMGRLYYLYRIDILLWKSLFNTWGVGLFVNVYRGTRVRLSAPSTRQHDRKAITNQDEWKWIFLLKQTQQHDNINTRMFIVFVGAQHVMSWCLTIILWLVCESVCFRKARETNQRVEFDPWAESNDMTHWIIFF